METELPAPSRPPGAIHSFCPSLRPHLGVEQHNNAHRAPRPSWELGPARSPPSSGPLHPPTLAAPRNRWDFEAVAEWEAIQAFL